MIDFIQGKIAKLTPTDVLIETPTFGFKVDITLFTQEDIKEKKEVKLFTHLHVKNEGQNLSGYNLYGFSTELERDYFKTVISVSGIGTSTARLMLSSLKPQEIANAIALEQVNVITSVKGIGPKTAKRLILELKDKLPQYQFESDDQSLENVVSTNNTIEAEALSALVMLGFSKSQALKAINSILKEGNVVSVEDLIKRCLKKL